MSALPYVPYLPPHQNHCVGLAHLITYLFLKVGMAGMARMTSPDFPGSHLPYLPYLPNLGCSFRPQKRHYGGPCDLRSAASGKPGFRHPQFLKSRFYPDCGGEP